MAASTAPGRRLYHQIAAELAGLPRLQPDPELPVAIDADAEIPPFALLQARRLLEPQTASLAALHAGDAELAAIEAALARSRADNRAAATTRPGAHLGDRLFPIRIAQASGNPAYALFITQLLGHRYGLIFQRLQRLYAPADMGDRSEAEHAAVLAAIP